MLIQGTKILFEFIYYKVHFGIKSHAGTVSVCPIPQEIEMQKSPRTSLDKQNDKNGTRVDKSAFLDLAICLATSLRYFHQMSRTNYIKHPN